MAEALPALPAPRRPPGVHGRPPEASRSGADRLRRWYESELGWETVPGTPPRLRTGIRFDVLDVPAQAGTAALRRLGEHAPVALRGERTLLLVAAGGAEELPGLLEWLEWGALPLDLAAYGAGGTVEAPLRPAPGPGRARQGAAVWLRPPEPGRAVEASLPALSAPGGGADLVRLVATVATQVHRLRLRRAAGRAVVRGDQPLAFS
ncbi:SCO3374 family protein [Streptomyces sp. CRN 30]|uniref:SCO3374 family protein n=1 Tax=Streptomyces sp. CRN 30 TaxID=3075613 RepID=UPI002A821196|nr:SCO3374 family protein [Streptomyces sp. CRN 30]